MLPSLPLASLAHIGMLALLVFGFGFVIFWHELGHFLAAKWVGIRVEQFAVGFGYAMFSWRKGIGFRLGNTQADYRKRAEEHLLARDKREVPSGEIVEFSDSQIADAAQEIGLGDTEYRLNWLPLGGYVKMLGQDDLKPDAVAEDPRAYNKKSVSARMLVISAGVIMNVILAAIGFMALFLMGFKVPPAWVGNVYPGSPAQKAGLMIGDDVVMFDGRPQEDFTKITLNAVLVHEGEQVAMVIDRPKTIHARRDHPEDFERLTLKVTPARRTLDDSFLVIGFEAPRSLDAPKADKDNDFDVKKYAELLPREAFALMPGERIVGINGTPVGPQDFMVLDKIVQDSYGKPVTLRIQGADKVERDEKTNVHFEDPFGGPFNLAGMEPRTQIYSFTENSKTRGAGKLQLGDVITSIKLTDTFPHPTFEQLIEKLNMAGHAGQTIGLTVLRDGKPVTVNGLETIKVDKSRYGFGMSLNKDEKETVIASITPNSPAKAAGLVAGDTILKVNGQPVATWFDVHRLLAQLPKDQTTATVEYRRENVVEPQPATLSFTPDQLASIHEVRYQSDIQHFGALDDYTIVRHTRDPLLAARWGVTETRDFILQFYMTLRRMVGGSVSPSNMMGPIGIFMGGKRLAYKGGDWLLWFLCMISANLAVVNFLPIPVVDGGQFMFLMLEKIKGKPLSAKAMTIAQYVGLAFLAAVVVFVTFNDLTRPY